MVQGTSSNAGKSLLVAGWCRVFARRGLEVRPFKPQNMSNNAAVGRLGASAASVAGGGDASAAGGASVAGGGWGELARAQALQARAARVAPHCDMNPVLLKPEAEGGASVVVGGRLQGRMSAAAWLARREMWQGEVMAAFARLSAECDLVLAEGAGSPAETNLRRGDLANMGFAEAAGLPVAIVADIERGGVIAQLVGTHALLSESERARVGGFWVNKFQGDPSLFGDGAEEIVRRTGWPMLGLLPWCDAARRLPPEDSLALETAPAAPVASAVSASEEGAGGSAGPGGAPARPVVVAVPRLPRLANADDLDPLRMQPGLLLRIVPLDAPPGALTAGGRLGAPAGEQVGAPRLGPAADGRPS